MARRIWTKCKGDVNFRGTSKTVPENSSRTILHQNGNVTGRDSYAVDIQAYVSKEHNYMYGVGGIQVLLNFVFLYYYDNENLAKVLIDM